MCSRRDTFRDWGELRSFLPILLCLMGCLWGTAALAVNKFDLAVPHPAIPILDEDGQHVLNSGKPYSPKMTCGNGNGSGCHDYNIMTHAFHFEQGRDEASDTYGIKRGLPNLVSAGYFGGYNCMSGSNPAWTTKKANANAGEFGDYSAAGFIKTCGSCHAGGGFSEYDRNGVRYDQMPLDKIQPYDGDYFIRQAVASAAGGDHAGHGGSTAKTEVVPWDWKKSGVVEADCMLCHADFKTLKKFPASQLGANDGSDKSDKAETHWSYLHDTKLQGTGYFRYVTSSVWEFLNVRPDLPDGMNLLTVERTITPKTTKPDYKLNLDASGNPIFHWNKDAFDANGKVTPPMLRFPGSENCMPCHLTGNSRRGFYGFGDEAKQTQNADGTLVDDYKDDVHKGVSWTEDNGQTRTIENCNACHAKQYYKPEFANVDLDDDHNFLKGNGDTDIRNDLDSMPPALSCEHCHDTAKKPALPSGQKNALDAHRELWKSNGDMAGYTADSLNKITQTHLDVVACQTCHITDIKYNNTPIIQHFRYRYGDDRKMKIFPYKPSYRYYAQEKKTGRVLYKWERDEVFEKKTGADGKVYGAIMDQISHQEVGKVTATVSATTGAVTFGTPTTYEDYKGLKIAYDSLMKAKGYADADVRFVYIESNEYAITHNTRTSPQARQCAECHERKQGGAFSSLVSTNGLFGEGNVIEVAKLPDRRLVDEKIFELGMPYYKIDDSGRITENVADVLSASKSNPSMTILNAETARAIGGEFKSLPADEASKYADLDSDAANAIMQRTNSGQWLLFNNHAGHESVKEFALILAGNQLNQALVKNARTEVEAKSVSADDRAAILKANAGNPASDIYSLTTLDMTKTAMTKLVGGDAIIKLPYKGTSSDPAQVNVLSSNGDGNWTKGAVKPVAFKAQSAAGEGYVMFAVSELPKQLALADPVGVAPSSGVPASGSGGSTGGTGNTAGAAADPVNWAAVKPTASCETQTCKKALKKANKALRAKANAAMRLQAAADKAALRAQRASNETQKAKAESKAVTKLAQASAARQAYSEVAATIQALHD